MASGDSQVIGFNGLLSKFRATIRGWIDKIQPEFIVNKSIN